jgi:hypothetical protein
MKNIRWLGDSKKALKKFPPEVVDEIGHCIWYNWEKHHIMQNN